jgi:hypothetical protein
MLLSLLAVFAISAVAAASASAHEFLVCQEAGTEKYTEHLCSAKSETGKWSFAAIAAGKSFEVEGTSGVSKLEGTVAAQKVSIECSADVAKVTLEPAGATKGTITFSGCKISSVTKGKKTLLKCVVNSVGEAAEKIKFPFLDLLVTGKGGGPEDEFKPAVAGEPLVTIETSGAECALVAKTAVKGTTICQLPEAEVGLVEHEIECSPSGSSLTLGTAAAGFFSSVKVKIVGTGAGWSWFAN